MTRIAEFEVGTLDILEVPQAELRHWRSAGVQLLQAEELRIVYIGLNNTRPPFNDPRLRRALNMAVDAEAIIAHVLFGAGKRARGLVPPPLRGSTEPEERYPYDPAQARQLLAEAGFPEGFAMEIWQRENPQAGRILESVQGYLARVGIEVTLVTREWGAFKQAIDQGTPDAFYLDWFADYPDAENFIAPLFHSANRGGGGNRAGYVNAAVDSLIDAAGRCGDGSRRWELYREAESLILDDAPWIFLWFPVRYEVVSPRLHGYRIPAIFNGQRFLEVTF
jgi:peptide/nickel transport system substrate-binding protein/oligopeptide transport system substrate-binding protein